MSIYEYDQEKHMRQEREQEFAEGHAAGVAEGVQKGLQSAVINMHESGMSIQKIAAIMKLAEEDVKKFL